MNDAGILTIDVSGLPIEATPRVELRDWDLRKPDRVSAGKRVVVVPGRYVVRLVRPGGDDDVQYIEVPPGGDEHVFLAGSPPDREREAIEDAALRVMSRQAPRDAGFSLLPWQDRDEPDLWYMRILSGADGERMQTPSPNSRPAPERHTPARVPIAKSVYAVSRGSVLAQVAQQGRVPLNVALPVAFRSCSLRVELDLDGGVSVAAAPDPGEDLGFVALAGYLATGLTTEALEIARGQIEWHSALGSLLAGLTLLRAGESELTDRSRDPNPELPDWHVLDGERALLLGDEATARGCFTTALEAGIPVFTLATHLLAARVHDGLINGAEDAARRLVAAAARSELSTLATTFPALHPFAADDTQSAPESFDEWFVFRRDKLETRVYA